MRYIIYGAGAVGGSIGGRLFEAGHDVLLIARGPHLEAIQRDGLTVRTPDGATTARIPAVGHPSEIEWHSEGMVVLTVKSQHTAAVLEDLAAAAGEVTVVCAQNGVANERMALRRFSNVYAMMVMLPATHLAPGEVVMNASPVGGLLDVGCYPEGADSMCEQIARDLSTAGLHARVDHRVMRLKYGKLLENLANAVQALCGLEAAAGTLERAVRAEGIAALQAAGIDFATESEMDQRRAESAMELRPIEGQRRGGSTWQSLARRTGSVETDYLNGEIALLGALHGAPTPFNRLLQRLTAEAARQKRPPGSYTVEELMSRAGAQQYRHHSEMTPLPTPEKGLYPPIKPYEHGMLEAGDGNLVYWETCGNPRGKPAVVLHGGPGSGCTEWHRRLFDPAAYRIVLFDQRNCGRSRPHASEPNIDLASNNTPNLIADIELLREHLEIDRWLVLGGSWGCTLTLAYAERYPSRVSELVLFGVTTGRRAEFDWLFRGGVAAFFPEQWERLLGALPAAERDGDIVEAYCRLLADPDPEVRQRAALEWCLWESATPAWPPADALAARFKDSRFAMAFARLVTHYVKHDAWIEDGALLRDAARLAAIPGVLVNGRFDFQSPIGNAWALKRAWPRAELIIVDDAGHAADNAGITCELVRATDRFAR